MYDDNLESHMKNVREFLLTCRENQITLNPTKCQIGKASVNYAGYVVSDAGVGADPNKVKAIGNFPVPKNITDLRSFMGLVNQLGCFSSHISKAANPLRGLMSEKNLFLWTKEHDESFNDVKQALCKPPILTNYDPMKPIVVQTDASRLNGIGYAMLQQHEDETWRLVQCGSRFLTNTESRYATIEMELLGIVYALKKCSLYLLSLIHI